MPALRLKTHLILYLTVVTFLLSLAIITINTVRFKEHAVNNLGQHGKTIAFNIAISVADYLIAENYAPLQDFVQEFSSRANITGIEISDADRHILAATNLDDLGTVMGQYPDEAPSPPAKKTILIHMDDKQRQLVVTAPIQVGDKTFGWARVSLSTEEILASITDVQKKGALISTFFWLISVFVGFFLARRLTKPMQSFMRATDSISQGDFKVALPRLTMVSELEKFSEALATMASAIASREEELRQSEKKFRHLFERAREGIFVCDKNGALEDVNPAMITLLGDSSKKDLLTRNIFSDFFPDQENVTSFLKQIVEKNFVRDHELQMTRCDDTTIEAAMTCHAVLDENGNMGKIEGLLRDITIQKKAAREISRMRNYLNNIIESMPSMLITVDCQGTISQWNSAAYQITQIPSPEAIGKNLWELLPSFGKYRNQFETSNVKRQPVRLHREQVTDDDERLYDLTFFPLIANGTSGVAIRLDDITEMENKEQQLRQAQKMESIGTLAGGLAHDFNNILSSIIGNLSLAEFELDRKGQLPEARLREFFTNMTEAGHRAADLVRQLLTLSRKQEINLVPVDLNLSIKHVRKLAENTFDKSVKFASSLTKSPATVLADPSQMEQVILNLCINAVHAMTIMRGQETWGGTLTVDLEQVVSDKFFQKTHPEASEPCYWKLSVSDTGVGMETKTVSQIFDPFFTTKEQGRGSGLGLAMAYNIVKQFNGFIDVYSEKGGGAIFNVYLPQLCTEIHAEKKEDMPRIHPGTGRILVVDDDKPIRNLARDILQAAGYSVLTAKNGYEGVEIYRQHQDEIDAVLLDMVMPVMSGKEAYLELKKINNNVLVLLSSGFQQDARVEEVLQLGVAGFLQKPYDMEALTKSLKEILAP